MAKIEQKVKANPLPFWLTIFRPVFKLKIFKNRSKTKVYPFRMILKQF